MDTKQGGGRPLESQSKRWVSRVSEHGDQYHTLEWCHVPRIHELFLECAFYLYPSRAAAERATQFGGSGFFVIEPAAVPGKGFVYAVSNTHVVRGSPVIRLNNREGGTHVLETDTSHWTYSEDTDLAVLPIDLSIWGTYQTTAIPTPWFIDKDSVVSKGIGPGDDTFTIGRFINQEGKQRNRPSVRFGSISTMPDPDEGIHIKIFNKKIEAYLVETRTRSGYSGSPVLVHVPPFSQRPAAATHIERESWHGPWLLGVDVAHLLIYEDVCEEDAKGNFTIETRYKAQSSTGMMCVIPAWKLRELLNDPAFVEERDRVNKKLAEPREPSVALDSAEPQENGIPQMPFNEALKRVWASKPRHRTTKHPAKKKTDK
jgi:hypothetical protein